MCMKPLVGHGVIQIARKQSMPKFAQSIRNQTGSRRASTKAMKCFFIIGQTQTKLKGVRKSMENTLRPAGLVLLVEKDISTRQ